jgi:outer membrane protein assembly factor BamB
MTLVAPHVGSSIRTAAMPVATTMIAAILAVCGPSLRLVVAAERPVDAAPADTWPMARGCPAGTGRSATTLPLPLAEAWHRDFEKTAFGAVPVIAAGRVYVGDLDGTFHALAVETGTTAWTFKAEAAGFPSAAAFVPAGPGQPRPLVVVGDDTGVVRGFDAETGGVVWDFETDGEISGGPTVIASATGSRVLVGSQDASLSCLAAATGTLLWKHSIADQIRCSPTVADTDAGPRVFLAGCDGKLHVLDAADGTERAAVAIDGPTGTTPAAVMDRVYFGTEGGFFFAIDFLKAEVAWRKPAAQPGQSYRSSAAVGDGVAIVGTRGRAVEALSLADGSRAWRHPTRGKVDASPVLVMAVPAAGGPRPVAVFGDAAGRIVAVDAANGESVWEFDAGGGFSAGAAVAAGRLVIASDDGSIWCFSGAGR